MGMEERLVFNARSFFERVPDNVTPEKMVDILYDTLEACSPIPQVGVIEEALRLIISEHVGAKALGIALMMYITNFKPSRVNVCDTRVMEAFVRRFKEYPMNDKEEVEVAELLDFMDWLDCFVWEHRRLADGLEGTLNQIWRKAGLSLNSDCVADYYRALLEEIRSAKSAGSFTELDNPKLRIAKAIAEGFIKRRGVIETLAEVDQRFRL